MAGETPVWLAPPEYVIIQKLEFFREGGRDIRGMLAARDTDHAMIGREVENRGLREAWESCQPAG